MKSEDLKLLKRIDELELFIDHRLDDIDTSLFNLESSITNDNKKYEPVNDDAECISDDDINKINERIKSGNINHSLDVLNCARDYIDEKVYEYFEGLGVETKSMNDLHKTLYTHLTTNLLRQWVSYNCGDK